MKTIYQVRQLAYLSAVIITMDTQKKINLITVKLYKTEKKLE